MFLILACSKKKLATTKPIPAKDLYQGAVFNYGQQYAAKKGWDVYILSAKYGLIQQETLIEPYNDKLKTTYDGPWSLCDGDGYYLGGSLYFGKAPQRIQPLLPVGMSHGQMVSALAQLIARDSFIQVPKSKGGVVENIYRLCCSKAYTKTELYVELAAIFGDNKGMRTTINCQLTPNRMGKERDCIIHKTVDERYWIEPK